MSSENDKARPIEDAPSDAGTALRSRRSFLRASGLMAASGAAAAAMLPSVAPAAEPASRGLARPPAFDVAGQTPAIDAALPMNGATLVEPEHT